MDERGQTIQTSRHNIWQILSLSWYLTGMRQICICNLLYTERSGINTTFWQFSTLQSHWKLWSRKYAIIVTTVMEDLRASYYVHANDNQLYFLQSHHEMVLFMSHTIHIRLVSHMHRRNLTRCACEHLPRVCDSDGFVAIVLRWFLLIRKTTPYNRLFRRQMTVSTTDKDLICRERVGGDILFAKINKTNLWTPADDGEYIQCLEILQH